MVVKLFHPLLDVLRHRLVVMRDTDTLSNAARSSNFLISAPMEAVAAGDSTTLETSEVAEATAEVALAATDETVARTL
jgi:hypothetical protein